MKQKINIPTDKNPLNARVKRCPRCGGTLETTEHTKDRLVPVTEIRCLECGWGKVAA